jgi:hypothetical protein
VLFSAEKKLIFPQCKDSSKFVLSTTNELIATIPTHSVTTMLRADDCLQDFSFYFLFLTMATIREIVEP